MSERIMLQSNSAADLKVRLAELDISVPLRSEWNAAAKGDGKRRAERYGLAHLLATLPPNRLSFPLTVTHSERPDFILSMPDCNIGIEHTEAVPQNVVKTDVLLQKKELWRKMRFLRRVTPGEASKTEEELLSEIMRNPPGDVWEGDSVEREWAEVMALVISKKTQSAKKVGFKQYLINWLIVYDNWPLPKVDYNKAAGFLMPQLIEKGAFAAFHAIFVYNESRLCEFQHDWFEVHPLVRPGSM